MYVGCKHKDNQLQVVPSRLDPYISLTLFVPFGVTGLPEPDPATFGQKQGTP